MPTRIGSLSGPQTITVVATRALTVAKDGVNASKGETFTTTPVLAAALTLQQKARFVNGIQRRRGRPRKDQTYRRRDLTAKSPDRDD